MTIIDVEECLTMLVAYPLSVKVKAFVWHFYFPETV
jgi:hypothetical protein